MLVYGIPRLRTWRGSVDHVSPPRPHSSNPVSTQLHPSPGVEKWVLSSAETEILLPQHTDQSQITSSCARLWTPQRGHWAEVTVLDNKGSNVAGKYYDIFLSFFVNYCMSMLGRGFKKRNCFTRGMLCTRNIKDITFPGLFTCNKDTTHILYVTVGTTPNGDKIVLQLNYYVCILFLFWYLLSGTLHSAYFYETEISCNN